MATHMRRAVKHVSDSAGALCGAQEGELTASLLFVTCRQCLRTGMAEQNRS